MIIIPSSTYNVLYLFTMNKATTVNLEIPFPSNRTAEVAYHVLRVDIEPKRSQVDRQLTFNENILLCTFKGQSKQIRTAVNKFFDKIDLILETIETFGEPVSDKYDHFY